MSQIKENIIVNQNNAYKSNGLRKLNNENNLNISKIIGKYKNLYIIKEILETNIVRALKVDKI